MAGRVALLVGGLLVSLVLVEGTLRWLDLADPPIFRRSPEYGYIMMPNQSVSTRGYRFSINRAGLRGLDFSVPKRPDVARLIFVGDSITYGGGSIRDDDLFVTRVAILLRNHTGRAIETINLAVPGWGIQNMGDYITHEGLDDADIVLWVVSAVDFRRPKTVLEDHGFTTQKSSLRMSYAAKLAWFYLSRHRDSSSSDTADTLTQNLITFRDTLRRITRNDTMAGVIFVPTEDGYDPQPRDLALFRRTAESLGFPTLDLAPVFARYTKGRLFLDGAHLSPEGHRVVGESIGHFVATLWAMNPKSGGKPAGALR